MKGCLPDSETLIMTSSNFNTMIEAVEYLIENDVVKKQESKLHTNLPIAHLRYTFYLVYKNEGKCVDRDKWLDFLGETFSQMQDNKASLSKHFSDKPTGYDRYLKPKKKKWVGKWDFENPMKNIFSGDWNFIMFLISTFLFVYQVIMDYYWMGFQ